MPFAIFSVAGRRGINNDVSSTVYSGSSSAIINCKLKSKLIRSHKARLPFLKCRYKDLLQIAFL